MKGLPKQYDPMILGLESSGIQLTADIVKAKILQDVKVSSEKQTVEAFLGNSKSTTKRSSVKSNVQCYRCKKMGHFASQCSNQFSDKKQEKSKNSGHATFFAAFNACQTSTAAEEEWIFDSGATSHLCRNRNLLVDAENVSSSINVANNTAVPVVAKGSVNVSADVGASTCAISMNDVLYVPELAVNLLSVSKMCQKGYTVTFRKQTCKVISPSNKLVAIGQESGGLYRLKRSPGSLVNMVSRMEDNFKLWHRRLCHMSVGCMKRLETMASGFEFRVTDGMQCVPCIQGKHHRHPFNIKGQRADRVLELIHSDLCGPMETASIGGNRYFITFIDDSSRKAFVYFLKSKTEVFETFKHFKSYAENQTGEKIKRIRSDNGREYMNREMKLFLCQAGIHHETSAPYTPEQNGLAERMNRTIVEKARSMLCDANLPKRFWAEAVATASYVINRSPTMGLRMTPHEAFTGRRPNLAHLRIFGAKVMCHVPKERRQKWDAKSDSGIFMGYSSSSKAYRVYNSKTKKVIVSRDVIFVDECAKNRVSEFEESSTEVSLGEFHFQPVVQDQEVESLETNGARNDDNDSEYDDAIGDQAEAIEHHEPQIEDPQKLVRRSERERIIPGKYRDFVMSCNAAVKSPDESCTVVPAMLNEPITYQEANSCEDSSRWKDAMKSEYDALLENRTWDLTSLPAGRKPLRSKWVYTVKTNADGSVER
uniref:Retrovirus-related Pol polyprotein from transposon TNT 1-94 n=1 Tax=Anopheles atroparvus TaxID=41427 RepID=A0AAG5CSP7_ANOAO